MTQSVTGAGSWFWAGWFWVGQLGAADWLDAGADHSDGAAGWAHGLGAGSLCQSAAVDQSVVGHSGACPPSGGWEIGSFLSNVMGSLES